MVPTGDTDPRVCSTAQVTLGDYVVKQIFGSGRDSSEEKWSPSAKFKECQTFSGSLSTQGVNSQASFLALFNCLRKAPFKNLLRHLMFLPPEAFQVFALNLLYCNFSKPFILN